MFHRREPLRELLNFLARGRDSNEAVSGGSRLLLLEVRV
jgi:hypothetical protein